MLEDEAYEKKKLQDEITSLQGQLLQLTFEADQVSNLSFSRRVVAALHNDLIIVSSLDKTLSCDN